MRKTRRKIDREEAEVEFGVLQSHEQMANGECRFRLTLKSGSGYILTMSGENCGWQHSHSHRFITEIYAVDLGWMALAKQESRAKPVSIRIFHKGDLVQVNPGEPHNVYLPKNAQIHTIKLGGQGVEDWVPEYQLDKQVEKLTENDFKP